VQANLVEAYAAGGETRLLSLPFHVPRAEPASSRAILWQLTAGFQPAAGRHASATMAAGRLPFLQHLRAPRRPEAQMQPKAGPFVQEVQLWPRALLLHGPISVEPFPLGYGSYADENEKTLGAFAKLQTLQGQNSTHASSSRRLRMVLKPSSRERWHARGQSTSVSVYSALNTALPRTMKGVKASAKS